MTDKGKGAEIVEVDKIDQTLREFFGKPKDK